MSVITQRVVGALAKGVGSVWELNSSEWTVIAAVVVGWLLFESGPKVLNLIRKRRERRASHAASQKDLKV